MNTVKKAAITTHILDLATGKPTAGVPVTLHKVEQNDDSVTPLGSATTDSDGRISHWSEPLVLEPGIYQLQFELCNAQPGTGLFFPWVQLTFTVQNTDQHYHIPLLLSPYGYSTYRGS